MCNAQKTYFSNPDIFSTWWRKPIWLFKLQLFYFMYIIHSLKYQKVYNIRFKLFRNKKIGICDHSTSPLLGFNVTSVFTIYRKLNLPILKRKFYLQKVNVNSFYLLPFNFGFLNQSKKAEKQLYSRRISLTKISAFFV